MSDGFVTVAQCVEGLPLGRCVWEALFSCFLVWFLLGSINEVTPFAFSLVSTGQDTTPQTVLALSAALAAGNFVAIVIAGWLSDLHGRLAVIQPCLLLTIASGIILQFSSTFSHALAARFSIGLVSGGLLSVVPPLIAEILPSRHRGFYLTVWCCGWPCGALYGLALGYMLPGLDMREYYTLTLAPAALIFLVVRMDMLFESPRFLYMAGRRVEGYIALIDMYDKEELPLPWAPESVEVTSALAWSPMQDRGSKHKASSRTTVTMWLALAVFFAGAAEQSVKLWMPTMLIAHFADDVPPEQDDAEAVDMSNPLNFAAGPRALSLLNYAQAPLMMAEPQYGAIRILTEAYVVEILGTVFAAYLSTVTCRKYLVQVPLLAAGVLTVLNLVAAARKYQVALCGPLVGLQFAAQATGLNFLLVFASEYFPTSRRAQTVAVTAFAAQLGSFAVPLLGGFFVHDVSAFMAVIFFAALYMLSWVASSRLPLPVSKERPLHDVDEERSSLDKAATSRKRQHRTTYQAA